MMATSTDTPKTDLSSIRPEIDAMASSTRIDTSNMMESYHSFFISRYFIPKVYNGIYGNDKYDLRLIKNQMDLFSGMMDVVAEVAITAYNRTVFALS
jgi:hypothetical protein